MSTLALVDPTVIDISRYDQPTCQVRGSETTEAIFISVGEIASSALRLPRNDTN